MATAALSPEPAKGSPCQDPPPKKKTKKNKKQTTYIAVGSASVPASLLPQGLQREGRGCSITTRAHGPRRSPPPGARGTYQVLELRREAAVVGLLHVHDLGVRPQDVKLPRPQKRKKKDTVWPAAPSGRTHGRTFAGVKSRSKKERKEKEKPSRLPPECCNITRVPRKGKREMRSRPRPPRTAGGVGGTASSPTTPPRAVPTTQEWISGTHGHPAPSPGVTPALSAGMGLEPGAAGTRWDPKSSTQGQSTGLTCRCRL